MGQESKILSLTTLEASPGEGVAYPGPVIAPESGIQT